MPLKKVKQIVAVRPDKTGILAEFTEVFAKEKINLESICGYVMDGKAIFYLISDNNEKVKTALLKSGWQIKEEEVLAVILENKPGSLAAVAAKLKAKNINLRYCYATAPQGSDSCQFIAKADNCDNAIVALK